jgi:hypothetical protein
VGRAKETAEAVNQQLADLQAELDAEVTSLQSSYAPVLQDIDKITIRPKKTGVVVKSILIQAK